MTCRVRIYGMNVLLFFWTASCFLEDEIRTTMTIVDKIRCIVLEYELDSVAVASEGMRIYLDFCLSRHVRDFSCLFFNL